MIYCSVVCQYHKAIRVASAFSLCTRNSVFVTIQLVLFRIKEHILIITNYFNKYGSKPISASFPLGIEGGISERKNKLVYFFCFQENKLPNRLSFASASFLSFSSSSRFCNEKGAYVEYVQFNQFPFSHEYVKMMSK